MFKPQACDDSTFRIPRQCIWLKINGSWPLKEDTSSKPTVKSSNLQFYYPGLFATFYSVWSWYVIVSVGITIYFQTAFLFHSFGDIIMLTENCCTTFMGALNFVRLLHLRLNQQQFKEILKQFVSHIWIVKDSAPQIELECKRHLNIYRVMTVLLSCLIGMYCLLPLVQLCIDGWSTDEKPFPYKMLFPFDAHHGWSYLFTYVFTAYAGICVVTTLFAEDSIFGFFVTYTCGQFQILHERIDSIVPSANAKVKQVDDVVTAQRLQLEYSRQLKEIAQKHSKLIEFANRLENFFNSILLVNFMISTVLICMVGFQLVTGKDMFIGDYVKFVVYISSSLSQLYILCWNGDRLIQISTETANHLYGCNWEGSTAFNTPTTTKRPSHWCRRQKNEPNGITQRQMEYINDSKAGKEFCINLQVMIMCSQRPVKITAFKFSTLSLQSFTRVLSTSLSYFTLLQTLYNNEN